MQLISIIHAVTRSRNWHVSPQLLPQLHTLLLDWRYVLGRACLIDVVLPEIKEISALVDSGLPFERRGLAKSNRAEVLPSIHSDDLSEMLGNYHEQ
jgi:hypothetical protein